MDGGADGDVQDSDDCCENEYGVYHLLSCSLTLEYFPPPYLTIFLEKNNWIKLCRLILEF